MARWSWFRSHSVVEMKISLSTSYTPLVCCITKKLMWTALLLKFFVLLVEGWDQPHYDLGYSRIFVISFSRSKWTLRCVAKINYFMRCRVDCMTRLPLPFKFLFCGMFFLGDFQCDWAPSVTVVNVMLPAEVSPRLWFFSWKLKSASN